MTELEDKLEKVYDDLDGVKEAFMWASSDAQVAGLNAEYEVLERKLLALLQEKYQ